ncbi:MAG: trypsin-like peptidase domain-containing protein, partial [Phycisphaerae bacterium]
SPPGPAAITELLGQAKDIDRVGVVIYRFRELLKESPNSVPVQHFLGIGLHRSGQVEEARKLYLNVIHADAGQTELTLWSLDALHDLCVKEEKPLAGLHCLASGLELDLANPKMLGPAVELLRKQGGFDAQVQELEKFAAGLDLPLQALNRLEPLPDPPANAAELKSEEIFAHSSGAVVLIQTGDGMGSGACVGKPGIIVTNQHVVGEAEEVQVRAFKLAMGKMVPAGDSVAVVIYRDARRDIAVLKMKKTPVGMMALPVAKAAPKAGQAVYAIGNPGLGRQILDNSISNGIISAVSRQIEGQTYIQHTAAINQGNSGGPLLNTQGQLIGINTLKGDLENVGFAVPAESIRRIFEAQKE